MIAADLSRLRATLAVPELFQREVFNCLTGGIWEREPFSLNASQQAELLELLAHWIAQATVAQAETETALMRARLPLRRLAHACGVRPAHLLSCALGLSSEMTLFELSFEQRHKLALLGDASFYHGFTLSQWAAREPRLAMLFAAAAADDTALEPSHAAAMRQLLEDLPELPLVALPPVALNLLHRACFMLGYQPSVHRYQAKQRLAQQAAGMIEQISAPRALLAAPRRSRPRLVIAAEKLLPGHAVYRFFGDLIKQLCSHFEVVLYADIETKCKAHRELSHQQFYFQRSITPVAGWADDLIALQPDLIFYPCIGISFMTFTMSQLRLAPLQVASSGHPSPSCSANIDASLLFDGLGAPMLGALPNPVYYHQHQLMPALGEKAATLSAPSSMRTIGINAMAYKLNANFLDMVRQIRHDCGVPTRLIMLPNVAGLEHLGLRTRLVALLGEVEVIPASSHASYMNDLAQCDIILQSFPFGGANTTIDGLNLGIPVVCLRGDSLSGLIDPMLLQHYDADAWCANDLKEYAETAVGLLREPLIATQWRTRRKLSDGKADSAAIGGKSPGEALHAYWLSSSRTPGTLA